MHFWSSIEVYCVSIHLVCIRFVTIKSLTYDIFIKHFNVLIPNFEYSALCEIDKRSLCMYKTIVIKINIHIGI